MEKNAGIRISSREVYDLVQELRSQVEVTHRDIKELKEDWREARGDFNRRLRTVEWSIGVILAGFVGGVIIFLARSPM